MNIGIIGAGRIGATTATLFAKAGHMVAISNSQGPESLQTQIQAYGPNVHATTPEEAIKSSEIVLIAIPWAKRDQLPEPALFENKITIDAMNAFGSHGPIDLSPSTSSETLSKQLPGARLVKAFNTMNSGSLSTSSKSSESERLVLFIAGDDTEAKATVAMLIEEIGFAAVDSGFLHEGGQLQQPGSPIFNQLMTVEEARQKLTEIA